VFVSTISEKLKHHRALSAVMVFVLFWLISTAAFFSSVNLVAQSDWVWSLRPYIWFFVACAPPVFLGGGLAVSLFLACWTWLDREKEKHRIWKSRLTRGASLVVIAALLGAVVGTIARPVNEPHLLLQYFFGMRDFQGLKGMAFYLERAELSEIDLSESDLNSIDLSGAALNQANFQDANLNSADVAYCDLIGANLVGAELEGAGFRFADLTGADLSGVDLRRTVLSGATLAGANLSGANLTGTNLDFVSLRGARIDVRTQMDERGKLIWQLTNQDSAGRQLRAINLHRADLTGARLGGANLEGAILVMATLNAADLKGANLRGANLAMARFSHTDLRSADLEETNLLEADLQDANLAGANLMGADLTRANLTGADLRGANLFSALVTDKQLAQARWLEGAILPGGSTK